MAKLKKLGNNFEHKTRYGEDVSGGPQGVQVWSIGWIWGVVLLEMLALHLTEEVLLRRKITYCTNQGHEVR